MIKSWRSENDQNQHCNFLIFVTQFILVCIAGSVVAALGLVLSTLSPNVPVLMLTYGVIGGFGLGLVISFSHYIMSTCKDRSRKPVPCWPDEARGPDDVNMIISPSDTF